MKTYGDGKTVRYNYKIWFAGMIIYEMDVDHGLERPIMLEVKDGQIVRSYGKWEKI